jgi:uncharacterized membrane protein
MLRRAALLPLAVVLVAVGALLWVDAGTRHSESFPQSSVLTSGGNAGDGPNRLPAQLVWTGAAVIAIAGVVPRREKRH